MWCCDINVCHSYRALGLLASRFIAISSLPHNPPSIAGTISAQGLPPAVTAVNQLLEGLQQLLSRNTTTHKIVSSLIVTFWSGCPKERLLPQLNSSLLEQGGYEELMPFLLALQKDCHVCMYMLYVQLLSVMPLVTI